MEQNSSTLDDILIESASHIHFLTNGQNTYVKLRNVVTNTYIDIIESYEELVNDVIVCDDIGAFVKITPCYDLSKMYIIVCTPNKMYIDEQVTGSGVEGLSVLGSTTSIITRNSSMTETYLSAKDNGSVIKNNGNKTVDSMFMLERYKDGFYIKTTNTTPNIYGEEGRYLYVTDDMCVHVDGDKSISTALWTFEKINDIKTIPDIRTDYKKELEKILSLKNVRQLCKKIFKYFTIKNQKYNKYMTAFTHSIEQPTQNGVLGSSQITQFVIRPIQSENNISNCVYISYYINGTCYNVYTLPRNKNVYLGAPDCNWAKFYIIEKSNNTYMFQVFHRECDDDGNYGRYLCMKPQNDEGDEFSIMSNGSESDNCSLWVLASSDAQ
jgi:hypothetical protein